MHTIKYAHILSAKMVVFLHTICLKFVSFEELGPSSFSCIIIFQRLKLYSCQKKKKEVKGRSGGEFILSTSKLVQEYLNF